MNNTVIKVENLSKQYRLGEVGTGTLSHDLKRWWYKRMGKDDPYLKIGEINDRTVSSESEYVWALQNIDFEVKQGEVLGIIGRNGAGKSTLLKILSKTTSPTTGLLKVKGRIASLLEVGTGFHPELTGKENIYLNGAILGMTKKEITKKFDEIVNFAGVERYINTPVKRYSSGMYVRLAFAVAANLESEILVVDEVLAVGDAEFQQKCLGKMGDVSKNEGRTILFVSHNMGAVKTLCNTGLLMNKGTIEMISDTESVIQKYLENDNDNDRIISWEANQRPGTSQVKLNSVKIKNEIQEEGGLLHSDQDIFIEIQYELLQEIKDLRVVANFLHADGTNLFSTSDYYAYNKDRLRKAGTYLSVLKVPRDLFNAGKYFISVDLEIPKTRDFVQDITVGFTIDQLVNNQMGPMVKSQPPGFLHPNLYWKVNLCS